MRLSFCWGCNMPDRLNRPLDTDVFQCFNLDRAMLLGHCLKYFMVASAFKNTESPCYSCGQGWNNRYCFGKGKPIPGQFVPAKDLSLAR